MLGCFEFLLLLGILAALLVLLGRFPDLGKILFWPLHNRRAFSSLILLAVFLLGLMAIFSTIFTFLKESEGGPLAMLFLFFVMFAVMVLAGWGSGYFLRQIKTHMKETPAERPVFEELAQLIGPIASRASRLSLRDLLLGSFVFVAPCVLYALVAYPPRNDPHPASVGVIILLFYWAICFAASWLVVWLLQKLWKLFRGPCPALGQLKDLLVERLSPEERGRLTTHLELCPVCQHRVEGLTAGYNSWPGLARKLSEREAEPEPALRKVMQQLKGNQEETTDKEPALAGDLPLGFLSPSEKPDQLGRLDRYEVLEEIGRGGMGVVLKAFDPSLHRVVAIKVLAPQLATSGVARKRFLREAKAAAAVTHDHIVTIHAVDEANGLPYLVMQYVAGQSLQQRIDKDGPLELADILRIGMQTASGLAAAHAHGIVHRDIKPANILLEEGLQRVKLTDFGLARAMDDASLTQSGFVAGSPLYMAPEQARGEGLDHRADLFSLGSVLYTMCTGRPPFRAANTLAVLRRVSEDPPRPIRETNPDIPDWLADLVLKLMAKEPAERIQSAAEVEEVLGRHLAQLQHRLWVPPARSPAPAAATDLPTSVTLCPSCGASLQVPERMVGSIVHCFECGKPFHVEDGSEVIQVARPAQWPPHPRFGWDRRLRGYIALAAGFAALMVLLLPIGNLALPARGLVAGAALMVLLLPIGNISLTARGLAAGAALVVFLLIFYIFSPSNPSMPPPRPVPVTAANPHTASRKLKRTKEAQPAISPAPKISPQKLK